LEWDVLRCWEFARLARNGEDIGWIRNRLSIAKKNAYEASTGLDIFNPGSKVMGVFAEEYLVKLRADTHRGMRGRVERGLSAGGRPYGYRTELAPGADLAAKHPPKVFVKDPDQAEVVRQIFEAYAAGEALRTIAHRLNAEHVPSPRKTGWAQSALQSILTNPLYKGERIWNRTEWVKDHSTGKKRKFKRPESEWLRQYDPSLQIVSAELWDHAHALRVTKGASYPHDQTGFAPEVKRVATSGVRWGGKPGARHLLSGFLKCEHCGGSFHQLSRPEVYGCGWRRDRGPDVCSSTLRVRREALEARVLTAIRERLVPEIVVLTTERVLEKVFASLRKDDPVKLHKRLMEIEGELGNLARYAAKSGDVDGAAATRVELLQEREALQARLAAQPVIPSRDQLRRMAEARVLEIKTALEGHDDQRRAALRWLLDGRYSRVGADPEKLFRVTGEIQIGITAPPAQQVAERVAGDVAGGRYTQYDAGSRRVSRLRLRSNAWPNPLETQRFPSE
jgi:DNA invertase Pin-like site-specific DNA recombinase